MLRTKLGLLGLCAVVLGMMAMSAGSAQASLFKWLILNAAKTTSTELKALVKGEKDSADLTLVTHLLGRLFWITCTNFELEGVNLEALGTLTTGGTVVFTGCEAYGAGPLTEPLGCNVKAGGAAVGTIKSNKGKGELLLHEGALTTKIEPEVPETFATILTENCIMPGSNPVRGKLFIKDCEALVELPCDKNAEVHKVKHLIEEGPLTELWVGTKNEEHLLTKIEGSAWVKLANSASGEHSGLEWAGIHNKP